MLDSSQKRCAQRFVEIAAASPIVENNVSTRYMRTQNSLVAWSGSTALPAELALDSAAEFVVVLPDVGAVLTSGNLRINAPARSISIVPAGAATIAWNAPGRAIQIFSPAPDALAARAVNAADYAAPRSGIRPIGVPLAFRGEAGIRVYPIDEWRPVAGRKAPTFQTATMNIMWLEQDGPHDATQLNPHAHDDFEEAALVVAGEYVAHLRTPWTGDARLWRVDEHAPCQPGTLVVVPPTVIHAAEGRGEGLHLMLNIFSPACADHIANGLVLNAGDYRASN